MITNIHSKRRFRVLSLLLAFAMLLSMSLPALAAAPTARSIVLNKIEGKNVTITKGSGKEYSASAGAKLGQDYVVNTGAGSNAYLVLDGETIVKTAPNSKVQIAKAGSKKIKVNLIKGSIAVAAAKQKDGEDVEVSAGNSTMGIRGTVFAASYNEQVFGIDMFSGIGYVSGPAGVYDIPPNKHLDVIQDIKAVLSDFDPESMDAFVLNTILENKEQIANEGGLSGNAINEIKTIYDEKKQEEDKKQQEQEKEREQAIKEQGTQTDTTAPTGGGGGGGSLSSADQQTIAQINTILTNVPSTFSMNDATNSYVINISDVIDPDSLDGLTRSSGGFYAGFLAPDSSYAGLINATGLPEDAGYNYLEINPPTTGDTTAVITLRVMSRDKATLYVDKNITLTIPQKTLATDGGLTASNILLPNEGIMKMTGINSLSPSDGEEFVLWKAGDFSSETSSDLYNEYLTSSGTVKKAIVNNGSVDIDLQYSAAANTDITCIVVSREYSGATTVSNNRLLATFAAPTAPPTNPKYRLQYVDPVRDVAEMTDISGRKAYKVSGPEADLMAGVVAACPDDYKTAFGFNYNVSGALIAYGISEDAGSVNFVGDYTVSSIGVPSSVKMDIHMGNQLVFPAGKKLIIPTGGTVELIGPIGSGSDALTIDAFANSGTINVINESTEITIVRESSNTSTGSITTTSVANSYNTKLIFNGNFTNDGTMADSHKIEIASGATLTNTGSLTFDATASVGLQINGSLVQNSITAINFGNVVPTGNGTFVVKPATSFAVTSTGKFSLGGVDLSGTSWSNTTSADVTFSYNSGTTKWEG